jgi:superfamily I DNA/RNA helicase
MAHLMLHKNILKHFRDLPLRVQKNVAELVERFQINPNDPAIHLHSLKESMVDPKVRGANLPDGYRAIIIAPEKGDTFLLMHIAKHDDAYAWAKNKRFEVHTKTGVFQIFDVDEIQEAAPDVTAHSKKNNYALHKLSDDDLFTAGVPRQLIPSVRAVDSDSALEDLSPYLPEDCREVLVGIAAGMGLDEAIESTLGSTKRELAEVAPVSSGDFTRIAEAPNFDLILIEDQAELREAMSKPLDEWRLFLHPSQRKIVQWNVNGPMSVNGSAGTGKTVVLMHRAVRLARELTSPTARILVTTFTTNLSHTLEAQIKQLDEKAATKIEVTNLHALARSICIRTGWKGAIAEDDDVNEIWDSIFEDSKWGDLPVSRKEIENEYEVIVDRNGIEDEDSYLSAVRSGLPRISREKRRNLWAIFLAFQREIKRRNLLTFEGAVHQARLACEADPSSRYAYVLVDEVQDFGLEALRLIKALSPSGEGTVNSLTVFGDGHQRIYGARIPLSRAGIEVRGRSRRLKLNYRTSEEIRRWAHGILKGMEVDDLNGDLVSTLGDRSAFKLMDPEVVECSGEGEESKAIAKWVKSLLDTKKYATHEICVTPNRSSIRRALQDLQIPTRDLKPRETDPGEKEPGVRLATMRRIKGLEFRAVVMGCASSEDALVKGEHADPRERALRYVAATRARERLLVTVPHP